MPASKTRRKRHIDSPEYCCATRTLDADRVGVIDLTAVLRRIRPRKLVPYWQVYCTAGGEYSSLYDMKLTQEEREAFLAEPHYGIVSVNVDPSRGPLSVPLWYQYTPGGEVWVLTGEGTLKADAIKAAGRFTLAVQRIKPTRRYVAVEGAVTSIEAATQDKVDELIYRYLEGGEAERHLDWLREHFENSDGENLRISMRPDRWLAADRGAF